MKPEIVVQVAFTEWTVHGKLRHPRLLGLRRDKAAREVTRERAVITHPEKVLFPDDGITKGELAAYYEAVAPVMLPHLAGRPVTMERFPRGIGAKGFIQKDVSKGFPAWLERVEVPKKGGVVHYPLANDARVAAVARQPERITPHVWTSRVPRLAAPRHLRVRPRSRRATTRRCCARRRSPCATSSTSSGCASWVKTSGSKGFHVVVPLGRASDVRAIARTLRATQSAGMLVAARTPTR